VREQRDTQQVDIKVGKADCKEVGVRSTARTVQSNAERAAHQL
jgi:hypothetical protein